MPILEKGSTTKFPKDSLVSYGEFKDNLTNSNFGVAGAALELAFIDAITGFVNEFGRFPDLNRILFRGCFTSTSAAIEICEIPAPTLM